MGVETMQAGASSRDGKTFAVTPTTTFVTHPQRHSPSPSPMCRALISHMPLNALNTNMNTNMTTNMHRNLSMHMNTNIYAYKIRMF